jgi:hypothetical protein
LGSGRRRADFDLDEERALRELMTAALRDGRVHGLRVAAATPRDDKDPDRPNTEFEANLRLVLGDLGVIVDDDPWAPDPPSLAEDEEVGEELGQAVNEALAFLRGLNSSESDSLTLYVGNLPKARLTRIDETALGIAIEEGMKGGLWRHWQVPCGRG